MKLYHFRESCEEANLWTQLQRDHWLSVGPGASQASGDCGRTETNSCLLDLEQVRHQVSVEGMTIEKQWYRRQCALKVNGSVLGFYVWNVCVGTGAKKVLNLLHPIHLSFFEMI